MALKPKRRNPRRRPLNPRVIPVEREATDPRDETTDLLYRESETFGPTIRARYEPRDLP